MDWRPLLNRVESSLGVETSSPDPLKSFVMVICMFDELDSVCK